MEQDSYNKLPSEKDGHLYWIDLFRFLAAFAVMAAHFRGVFFVEYGSLPPEQQTPLMFFFYAITRLGHEPVMIFFVLSGFLVGGKALDRAHRNQFNSKSYAIDRFVRIMLPLISSLILAVIVNSIIGKDLNLNILLGNLFSLQGIICGMYFDTLWTLSYEVWFYILMGGIGYCVTHRNHPKAYSGIVIITLCSLVFTKLSAHFLFVWFIGAFGFMLLGRKSRITLYISLVVTMILIGVLQLLSGTRTGLTSNLQSSTILPYLDVAFGLVFVICLIQLIQFPPKHKTTIALNNIGTKLAAFSYTLYLTHIPVRDLLIYLGAPKSATVNIISLSLFIGWLIVALSVAYVMYLLFEKNTNIVKRWIKNRLSKKELFSVKSRL